MRAKRSWLCLVLLYSAPALADDTHYHDYPLGGRAVGLGGAFVAIANDPSGIFYNPAGLVNARRSSVQVSTNLYGLEVTQSSFSEVSSVEDLQSLATELNVIPSSAAFTNIVERDRMDRAITAYGLGSFVPAFRNSRTRTSSDGMVAGCQNLTYRRDLADRTFMFGGAMAHRINDVLRFGVSGMLSYRTLNDQEQTSCFERTGDDTAFADAETNLRLVVASIVVTAGAQLDLSEGFALGVTLSSPSIRAFDFADISVRRTSADPMTGTSEFLSEDLQGLRADTKVGPALRIGGAWVEPRHATIAADVVIHTPTKYALFEEPRFARRRVADGLTVVREVERRWVVNFNLGAEILLSRSLSLAVGGFSNFSSAPAIPKTETLAENQLAKVGGFGGSLVLGFFSGGFTLTRVGALVSYGAGSDVAPRIAGLGSLGRETDFVRAEVSELFVFLFISSTFRY